MSTSPYSDNNTVSGNYIGQLNPDGNLGGASTNNWGFVIRSANNLIGGSSTADRNVISGNAFANINLDTATSIGNTVQGNYIGTDLRYR